MESKLFVKERQLVLPGEALANGLDYLPGAGSYRLENELRSKLLGLVRLKDRFVSIVPLAGVYVPRQGDGVIAVVEDMQSTFWILNINSPYDAIMQIGEAVGEYVDLTRTDISAYYDIGDVIYAKVLSVSKSKQIQLTMNDPRAKKLTGGRTLHITPSKVPRLIGKAGTMVEMIKAKTECQIVVGQNGVVWIKGQKEGLAAKAVLTIEREAHTTGLTDRMTAMLEVGE